MSAAFPALFLVLHVQPLSIGIEDRDSGSEGHEGVWVQLMDQRGTVQG